MNAARTSGPPDARGDASLTPAEPRKRPRRRVADDGDLPMLRIAIDEGKRLLDDQVAELDGMRQRTVQFLAFVGSATAFLVGAGLSSGTRDFTFTVLAVSGAIFFILVLCLALSVLQGVTPWKKKGGKATWNFRLNPAKLAVYLEYDIGRPDEAQFLDEAVRLLQENADKNEQHLKDLRRTYWTFLVAASLQILLWVVIVTVYR